MAATMDAKQLVEAGKQILKAAESGDPSSTLLNLLKPLHDFTATDTLLRQSKIGIAVNKLRQNKDSKVSDTASRLINKWKVDIKGGKAASDGAAGVKKPSSSSSPAPSAAKTAANGAANGSKDTASPAPAAAPVKKEHKSSVPPEKRTADTDGVKTGVTGDAARDGCLKLIYNGLAFMSTELPDEILNVARSVELAAYNSHNSETSAAYKQKMRSLFMNLKMKENTQLRADVFSGKIAPQKFVTMTSEELRSDEKRAEIAKIEKENMSNAQVATVQKAISVTMTCGKCKESRVAYTQAQTRAADEPMTTFCECTLCGHRWKFS